MASPDPTSNDQAAQTVHRAPAVPTGAPDPGGAATRASIPRRSRASPEGVGPGDVISNRFVIERLIGSGGMGAVYEALDRIREAASDPRPRVAVKVLHRELQAHSAGFQALQREASRSQELAHPNIVTFYDFAIDEARGVAYATMELLEGQPLDALLRDANEVGLEHEQAFALLRSLCAGLSHAHRKGWVHCDLKPGNVFVTNEGEPKLLDFGIARAAEGSSRARADTFDAGVFGGMTALYASPEMFAEAQPHPADDVFALGIIAYEMFAGRHPFNRRPSNEARDAGLQPAPIRGLSRRQFRAIEKALAFDRAERWRDASEFARALEGLRKLPIALGAAAAAFALVIALMSYRSYVATLPETPLESLPGSVQARFRSEMEQGSIELEFFIQGQSPSPDAALAHFTQAYSLHPRNPQVVAALRDTADAVIAGLEGQADVAASLQTLRELQRRDNVLADYEPLSEAIARLERL